MAIPYGDAFETYHREFDLARNFPPSCIWVAKRVARPHAITTGLFFSTLNLEVGTLFLVEGVLCSAAGVQCSGGRAVGNFAEPSG